MLYAYTLGSVSAERFGILIALGFVAFAYVGGITMVSGAVFGGLIASEGLFSHATQDILGISGTWTLLIGGVTLILNLILFPDGVAGSQYQKKKRRRSRKRGSRSHRRTRVASPVAPPRRQGVTSDERSAARQEGCPSASAACTPSATST